MLKTTLTKTAFVKTTMAAAATAMLLGAVQAEAGQRAKRVQLQASQAVQMQLQQAPQEAPRTATLRRTGRAAASGHNTVGGLAGNGNALANLVVVPYYNNGGLPEGMPGESFCSNGPGGGASDKVRFWIKNLGNTAAPSFQWNLFLWESGDAPGNVIPSIPAGGKKLVTHGIPADCYTSPYHGQCPFKIELDYHNEVAESNESDNEVSSFCLSPAT